MKKYRDQIFVLGEKFFYHLSVGPSEFGFFLLQNDRAQDPYFFVEASEKLPHL